jgi:hypothetical protein
VNKGGVVALRIDAEVIAKKVMVAFEWVVGL